MTSHAPQEETLSDFIALTDDTEHQAALRAKLDEYSAWAKADDSHIGPFRREETTAKRNALAALLANQGIIVAEYAKQHRNDGFVERALRQIQRMNRDIKAIVDLGRPGERDKATQVGTAAERIVASSGNNDEPKPPTQPAPVPRRAPVDWSHAADSGPAILPAGMVIEPKAAPVAKPAAEKPRGPLFARSLMDVIKGGGDTGVRERKGK